MNRAFVGEMRNCDLIFIVKCTHIHPPFDSVEEPLFHDAGCKLLSPKTLGSDGQTKCLPRVE